jgi:drug/metabolite transporter (DMT)-like permease
MQVLASLSGRSLALRAVLVSRPALLAALIGTTFGPVFGVWLSMVALRHADDGVAAALMATTPVFMLPVSVWFYGARIGVLGVVGTLLAVWGVACLLR